MPPPNSVLVPDVAGPDQLYAQFEDWLDGSLSVIVRGACGAVELSIATGHLGSPTGGMSINYHSIERFTEEPPSRRCRVSEYTLCCHETVSDGVDDKLAPLFLNADTTGIVTSLAATYLDYYWNPPDDDAAAQHAWYGTVDERDNPWP